MAIPSPTNDAFLDVVRRASLGLGRKKTPNRSVAISIEGGEFAVRAIDVSSNDFRRIRVEKELTAKCADDVAGAIAGVLRENDGKEICCLLTWGEENIGKWTWVHPITLEPFRIGGQVCEAEFRKI